MKDKKKMCVYKINSPPYFAVSVVHDSYNDKVIVESTNGSLNLVEPLYVGPFDSEKFLSFGTTLCSYFKHENNLREIVKKEACSIFSLDTVAYKGDINDRS